MRILRLIRLSHKAEYCRHFKIIFSLVYHTTEELTCLVNILFTDSPQRSNVQIDPVKNQDQLSRRIKEYIARGHYTVAVRCLHFLLKFPDINEHLHVPMVMRWNTNSWIFPATFVSRGPVCIFLSLFFLFFIHTKALFSFIKNPNLLLVNGLRSASLVPRSPMASHTREIWVLHEVYASDMTRISC